MYRRFVRKHNIKISPSKARLDATDVKFLGHSISPAGLRPNAENVSAIINMPMPMDAKQVRALIGSINYFRIFLPDLSKRIRPINSLSGRGLSLRSRPQWKKRFEKSWRSLRLRRSWVSPTGTLSTTAFSFRPFHVYCDACIDGFGTALEQEQADGSIKPIAYISRVTLDS